MKMICESGRLSDYVCESKEVDYSHPMIKEKAAELFHSSQTEMDKAKIAFEFVRDEISHSWDIQSKRVTCHASDVLRFKEGICYAKSNLFAALLRGEGIPTGFCYQRLMLFDTPDKGYCIHALNAVYLSSVRKWVRVDARGNKEGVNAQFSIHKERLAFQVNERMGEQDKPMIYTNPHSKTLAVLNGHTDALKMYLYHLPDHL
ncbi:transglutaminase-like domain-containing protein [Bacillus spizizenii]|uniref:transglutaminase-like domain-containing protein n=1 Tax=Bacillus spizizenii TaxID=96241 RepID=UPI002DB9618C|nr:transglutaminase-like domain-containing protein [Bacillus spizizenii]MEC1584945.1 transglutaminase-like domain-containing protein [Bacillus spizizenii]